MDEIVFLREQIAKEAKENATLKKSVTSLYHDAEINAEAKSKLALSLREAKAEIVELTKYQSVDIDLQDYLDPAPEDAEERALYIGRIAGYFNGGLMQYLKYMLSNFKSEISRFPLTERETDFHRAGVNLCHLLMEWGDEAIREHHANIQGSKDVEGVFDTNNDEDDDAVENIKRTVNN